MASMREIRPHRAVNTRCLARNTARLLDEIDETGEAVAVVRYGRIVAVLAPFDNGQIIAVPEAPLEPHMDELHIRDADRRVFELIAEEPNGFWSPDQKPIDLSIPEVLGSLTRLELAGLIERNVGSFRLTKLGRNVRH
jgi:antitoxin (DNA-binding transcriptional repressor) of toxin-antitoxin stability system